MLTACPHAVFYFYHGEKFRLSAIILRNHGQTANYQHITHNHRESHIYKQITTSLKRSDSQRLGLE